MMAESAISQRTAAVPAMAPGAAIQARRGAKPGPRAAGEHRSQEAPNPLGSPQVPGHEATVGSQGGGGLMIEELL